MEVPSGAPFPETATSAEQVAESPSSEVVEEGSRGVENRLPLGQPTRGTAPLYLAGVLFLVLITVTVLSAFRRDE